MQARLVALLLATEPEAARAHALHELQVRTPCAMCCMMYLHLHAPTQALHPLQVMCMHVPAAQVLTHARARAPSLHLYMHLRYLHTLHIHSIQAVRLPISTTINHQQQFPLPTRCTHTASQAVLCACPFNIINNNAHIPRAGLVAAVLRRRAAAAPPAAGLERRARRRLLAPPYC